MTYENHEQPGQAQAEAVIENVKQAFEPFTNAFKNLQGFDVPEATRDFVKRAAGTAKEKAADLHAGTEKVTSVIEDAVANSVSEAAKISRNVQQALRDDAETFFNGVDRLASAKSVNEAVQIQSDLVRSQGEVLLARAKSTTEYFGKVAADSAKSIQDSFAKGFGKSA